MRKIIKHVGNISTYEDDYNTIEIVGGHISFRSKIRDRDPSLEIEMLLNFIADHEKQSEGRVVWCYNCGVRNTIADKTPSIYVCDRCKEIARRNSRGKKCTK